MSGNGTEPKPPYGDGFLSDMSGYEEYINPIRKKRDAFLTVWRQRKSGEIRAGMIFRFFRPELPRAQSPCGCIPERLLKPCSPKWRLSAFR